MSITWAPLELRKASNLRREVDEACKRFNEAIETGNKALEKELRRAFAERIDQLEDFYLRHDDDERAVLFEKQRLRMHAVDQGQVDAVLRKDEDLHQDQGQSQGCFDARHGCLEQTARDQANHRRW